MADVLMIVLALIFLIGIVIAYTVGINAGKRERDSFWEEQIPLHRKDAITKSRAVLGGQFSEQLAPYLPDFPFSPTECRFLGKPVDFIVFKGSDQGKITEVIFVETKSGKSKLSSQERGLKEAVEGKKVRWQEYRVPEELTKKKDN